MVGCAGGTVPVVHGRCVVAILAVAIVTGLVACGGGSSSTQSTSASTLKQDSAVVEGARVYSKKWNELAGEWLRTIHSKNSSPEDLRAFEPQLAAQAKGLGTTVPKIQDAGLRAKYLAVVQTYREKLRAVRHIDDAVADGKPVAVRRGFDELDAAGTHALNAANDLQTYIQQHS